VQQARRKLKETLPAALTPNHRQFLLGLVMGEPDWQLMKCPHLAQLPQSDGNFKTWPDSRSPIRANSHSKPKNLMHGLCRINCANWQNVHTIIFCAECAPKCAAKL
jgi:hypothetical protein